MSKKKLVIVNAPPFGGKSHLKRILRAYKVTCIDMSDLITAKENSDPEFAVFSRNLRAKGQLFPCTVVLETFEVYFNDLVDESKFVLCGIPRTKFQAHAIAEHPVISNFSDLLFVDVTVPRDIRFGRFEKRKVKEDRTDDTLDNFKDRYTKFLDNRQDVLRRFNSHQRWSVKCIEAREEDATETLAKNLIKRMNLQLNRKSSHPLTPCNDS